MIVTLALGVPGLRPPLADQGPVIRLIAPPAAFVGEPVTLIGAGLGGHNVHVTVHDVPALVLAVFDGFGSSAAVTFRVPDVPKGPTRITLTTAAGRSATAPFRVLNHHPVADAGRDQTVLVTSTVQLDGRRSSDRDGDALSYHWAFVLRPPGSGAELSDPTSLRPTFVVDHRGTYVLQLVVNDGESDSVPDCVRIDTHNSPAVASAGPDQTVAVGATVQLDGSASADVDGDLLRFRWTFQSRPAGSHATLTDATAERPAFIADLAGRYVLALIVNDGHADSKLDTVQIDTGNSAPHADAGTDQTVMLGSTVHLDGTGSSDADGDHLTYRWSFTTRPAGSTASLFDPAAPGPTFVADTLGIYVVQLITNDGIEDGAPDTVVVTAQPANHAPVVSAGLDKTITLPTDSVTLDGSVSDAGLPAGALTIGWSTAAAPGAVMFDSPNAPVTLAHFPTSGTYVLRLTASDGALSASATVTITVNPPAVVNTPPVVSAGASQTITLPASASLAGTVSDDGLPNPPGAVTTTWSVVSGPGTTTFGDTSARTTTAGFSQAGTYVLRLTASDGALSASSDVTITVNPAVPTGGNGPPDPKTIAPPATPGVTTTIANGTAFLYTGPNPIQSGVAPGTIQTKRAAVVRGRVLDRANAPLPGVTVTILDHPELGQTVSRADGMFDMVVNGGGRLTIDYTKAGVLPAQRQVNVPWQDFTVVDDVVLVTLDPQGTSVTLGAGTMQVAQGSTTTDADGARRATLLFPAGVQAQMVMPDGSTQPLGTLTARATEYTVGANGPNAMPGALPPTSGYTYAVELSADEALAAGARSVTFNPPLIHYVENFVGFPVGSLMPAGYYDRTLGRWVAEKNGRVIKVLGITGGLADLDVAGNGAIADVAALAVLGITDAERQRLAAMYTAGQSLWRVPIPHFSPWDFNKPYGPGPNDCGPGPNCPPNPNGPHPGPQPPKSPKGDDPCTKTGGSSVDCQTQVLGEDVAITGVPFSLHHGSDRVGSGNALRILLTSGSVPPTLVRVQLEVRLAGRVFTQSFAPGPNLETTFQWDGRDAYGRMLQGPQPVTVRIGYDYIAQYYSTQDSFDASFNQFGSPPVATSASGTGAVTFTLTPVRGTAPTLTLWRDYQDTIGRFNALSVGLGGFTLSVHHVYDPISKTLYLGSGGQRAAVVLPEVIASAGGNGQLCDPSLMGHTTAPCGDGGPASVAQIGLPTSLAIGPDGSLYLADDSNRIRRIGPDGVIRTIAGTGEICPGAGGVSCGDGGTATAARIAAAANLALGPDGSVYFVDNFSRIRRIRPDGIIDTVVGTGGACNFDACGDGGPASSAPIGASGGLVVSRDNTLYFGQANVRIRQVGPDGIVRPFAGNGTQCPRPPFQGATTGPCGDGGLATAAAIAPVSMALGVDGSLYFADGAANRIRMIRPDGIVSTVAGDGSFCVSPTAPCGDGGPAASAQFSRTPEIVVGPDGSLFLLDYGSSRIRRIGRDGVIRAAVGNGGFCIDPTSPCGDGGPATAAVLNLGSAHGISVIGPDGTYYFADTGSRRLRRVGPVLPGVALGGIPIPSDDGREIYGFDGVGRHLNTVDALTGALRWQFGYDGSGRLGSVTDGDGKVTTIERSGVGPSAIAAPGGQRTALVVNGDGYLTRIANPAAEAVQLAYGTGPAAGFLTTLTDARGGVHRYTYDTQGRLVRDESPAGGLIALARTDVSDARYTVAVTTATGLVTTYDVEDLPTGETRRVRIDPGGARTETLVRPDASQRVAYPDGTVTEVVEGPDPRFGMQAPILTSLTVTTPAGSATTRLAARSVTLSDVTDVSSLITQTDTLKINGQTYTSVFDAATRTTTTTTPAGRTFVTTLDTRGRVARQQSDPGLGVAPVLYTYDARGRLTRIQADTQRWDYAYDALDRLASRTDAAGNRVTYAYDAADRPSQTTLPGQRTYAFAYDGNGNPTQVTLPSAAIHAFAYTPADLQSAYTPPGESPYTTAYDADRRTTRITLPGGRAETFSFDSANRPTGVAYPEAAVTLAYTAGDSRISHLARTPAGEGAAQDLAFSYNGDQITGLTLSGAAAGQYQFAYDGSFLLRSTTLTSGADSVSTALTRDGDGLVTGLGPFTLARGGTGGLATQIGDGTLAIAVAYDALGRSTSRTHTVGGQSAYAVQLTFDNVERITRKVETAGGASHTYDYSYRVDSGLSEVRRDGALVEAYAYDANGNRVSRALGGGPAEAASYDAEDRLTQRGALAYQFDVDGYLARRGGDTFTYSTTGELLQAVAAGQTVTYAYDGLRRRVSRGDGAGTTQYFYGNPDNDLQLTHTRDAAGTLTTYYYDDGRRLFAMQRDATRYYVASDHLGSPRVIVDSAGAVVKTLEYDAFGGVTLDSNPGFELALGFAGGLSDRVTGLVRFGLRDYDPAAGRWTARDQAVFGGSQVNLYAYVGNNPVSLVDPSGLVSTGVTVCDLFCAGFKFGLTKDGISACVEGGFGFGSSLEFDPFADLDKDGVSLEAKFAGKLGIAKSEVGFELGECHQFKPKGEVCVGPLCTKVARTDELDKDLQKYKSKGSFEEKGGEVKGKNPFQGSGIGVSGRVVGKLCQQARW